MALGSTILASYAQPVSMDQQAQELAGQFVSRLKPQLKQAMNKAGPGYAVEVCANIAPDIAATLSAESGWQIGRVSLKARNASQAEPDSWEQSVLYEFNRRQAAGEPAAQISFGEVVDGQYRYMQAQGVEPLCLVCHGKGLSEEVQLSLKKYYPDDTATGYSLGQVRGAISLSRDL
jgi:hypothetical protein